MQEPLRRSDLARMAAVLFGMAGLLGVLSRLSDGLRPALTPEQGLALGIALAAWWMPWDRWPRKALLGLALVAIALKTLSSIHHGVSPDTYGLHYLVLFMWIGVAIGRGVALALTPLAGALYALPLELAGASGWMAALSVLPVCTFTGEATAWLAERLGHADELSKVRATKMAGLVDATLALASTHEPDQLAQLTAIGAADLYGADGAVVLLEDDAGALHVAGEAGLPPECLERLDDAELVALAREGMRHPDGLLPVGGEEALARGLGLAAVRGLPLRGSGEAQGIALVVRTQPAVTPDQFTEYVVRTLATQAGLGFERVRAARALLDESLRDALTGLGNRRAAMAMLERLKAGDVVSLIDLDRFKAVNDTYGHAAGDRVLRTLGEFLRSSVRGPDAVFRLGGEEFLIVLPRAGRSGLVALRRIHDRWRRQERVTSFSAGVTVHAPGESAERTLARADEALYEAKRAGRDRVVFQPAPTDDPDAAPAPREPAR